MSESCSTKCCFDWKNPCHIVIALALLPFAVSGAQKIVGWLSTLVY